MRKGSDMGTLAVTVYSKPQCVQCDATKKRLTKFGVAFTEVDITEDAGALEYVTDELGYMQAPVVVVEDGTGEDHWSGFRLDCIQRIAGV